MNVLLEMEKKLDSMPLKFEEINSTIDKYINNLESDDDEELAPRKNKAHNNNIKPPTPNPRRVIFDKEPNGIYDTGAASGFGALKDEKYFISTGKISRNVLVITNSNTMLANETMKLAHELR